MDIRFSFLWFVIALWLAGSLVPPDVLRTWGPYMVLVAVISWGLGILPSLFNRHR